MESVQMAGGAVAGCQSLTDYGYSSTEAEYMMLFQAIKENV